MASPFQRGHDPRRNYAGRPLGTCLTEQLNLLGNTIHEKGGLKELRRIQRDDTEPLPRREAAKILLRTMEDGFSKSGKPLAGDDL